jgi:signal transduction histidine kinase
MTLQEFITSNRAEIIRRSRGKSLARSNMRPTTSEIDDGIPHFLDGVERSLRRSTSKTDISIGHAVEYGGQLQRSGFTVGQVVHGYGDVCQSVTELAVESDANISVDDFRIFNRCLDDATADAVTEYERRHNELVSREGTERAAILAHELRNSVHTAILAFSILKRGAVGTDSGTATLLNRSLTRLHDILERSLADVKLEAGARLSRIVIADLIEDSEIGSVIEGTNRNIGFSVSSTPGLEADGDPLLLAGALSNLVRNAFKFTPEGGHISLSTRLVAGRVLIDVADECGGLPAGKSEELFRLFEQRSADRSGLGVGLSVAQSSVRAMGGEIHVRDLPGKGCVFTIDIAQSPPR